MKILIFCMTMLMVLPVRAQGQDCILKKSQDLLDCALARHPEIQEADISLERDQMLKKIARQRENPELESRVVSGDDGETLQTEATLLHTVELGGKRRARIRQAQVQGKLASINFKRTQEEIAMQVVLTAHRLRQIRTEKRLTRENTETFNTIIASYKSRSILSPEQQVSLSVFEAGKQEMAFKTAALAGEEGELMNNLVIATGATAEEINRVLPGEKKKWPSFSEKEDTESSVESQAAAELELATENVKLARSGAWPNLKLGPTVETERLLGDNSILAGGSLQIPLPILSHNRGNKAYAQLEEKRARLHYDGVRGKTELIRQNAHYRYKLALQAVRQTIPSTKSHENMDELFHRGLVTTSLMIEAHRQNLELAELRHARELEALQSMWELLILDGRFSEGTL